MKKVLRESNTIRVVADLAFAIVMPAKLKKAILVIVPKFKKIILLKKLIQHFKKTFNNE